jgi:TetR/AcrR family transcriptional repressor of nem operon
MSGRPKEFERDDVLRAAIRQFWTHGFEASSINDLLDAMGINRQSVYNEFGDKHQLFMVALTHYAEKVSAEIGEVLSDAGQSPMQAIRGFFKALRDRTTTGERIGCLLTNTLVEVGPHDAKVRKFITGIYRGLEDRLAELIGKAMAAGEIPGGRDPRQLARFVVSVFQGSLVLSKGRMDDVIGDAIAVAESVLTKL